MQRHLLSKLNNNVSPGKEAVQLHRAPGMARLGGLSLAIAASACVAALAGCAGERPQSVTTRGLDTGITSSNGGAMRASGNTLNQGVTTRVP